MTPRPPADPRVRAALDVLAECIAAELLREIGAPSARDATTPDGETVGVAAGETDDEQILRPGA